MMPIAVLLPSYAQLTFLLGEPSSGRTPGPESGNTGYRWGRQALSENLKQVPTPSLALAFLTLAETFSQLPSLLKLFQKHLILLPCSKPEV